MDIVLAWLTYWPVFLFGQDVKCAALVRQDYKILQLDKIEYEKSNLLMKGALDIEKSSSNRFGDK